MTEEQPETTSDTEGAYFLKGPIPSLNGWRAISVSMVLFAHSKFAHEPDAVYYFFGSSGVRFFFVISGFLITWLLLREETSQGNVSLRNFYIRRGLRILPVYYVFLAAAAIISLLVGEPIQTPLRQWLANLSFTANYSDCSGVSGHLWSLSVEEQFYLLWPIVFFRIRTLRARTLVLVACIVAAPLFRGISYLFEIYSQVPVIFHRFSFLLHFDSISWGCLASLILWTNNRYWIPLAESSLFIPVGALLGLIHPLLLQHADNITWLTIPLSPSIQALSFLTLMLRSMVRSHSAPFLFLNIWPVAWLGTLSYSLYLWHPLFIPERLPFCSGIAQSTVKLLWILPALAVAALSFYLLEKPVMSLRRRYSSPL
jgi:peptidoglycan/LPS O-acetylase OafA/YrhL